MTRKYYQVKKGNWVYDMVTHEKISLHTMLHILINWIEGPEFKLPNYSLNQIFLYRLEIQ